MPIAWMHGLLLILTLCLSLSATRAMIAIAHRRGWLYYPKADRWSETPTPLYGGVAIFLAFSSGALSVLPGLFVDGRYDVIGLLCGGALMFAVGLRDDIRPLDPQVKMLGQVMSVTPFLIGLGYTDNTRIFLHTIPLVLFWCVALTNSFNLLDNMDGLSAGTAGIIGCMVALYSALHGRPADALLSALLVAGIAGFLWFNMRVRGRARIFMGDCGSMFVGYTLAGLTITGVSATSSTTLVGAVVLPILIMAVPIFDTTLVIIIRKREGRAISVGGRDHSSHRLVYAGLTEKQAVCLLYCVTALAGGTAVLVQTMRHPDVTVLTAIICAVTLCWLGTFLSGYSQPRKAAAQPASQPALDAETL